MSIDLLFIITIFLVSCLAIYLIIVAKDYDLTSCKYCSEKACKCFGEDD